MGPPSGLPNITVAQMKLPVCSRCLGPCRAKLAEECGWPGRTGSDPFQSSEDGPDTQWVHKESEFRTHTRISRHVVDDIRLFPYIGGLFLGGP